MALVLGMMEGKEIYIGKEKISLESVKSPNRFVIKVHGAVMDRLVEVDNTSRTELFPDVFVSAGPTHRADWAKIVIEAPQSVKIVRAELLERNKQ